NLTFNHSHISSKLNSEHHIPNFSAASSKFFVEGDSPRFFACVSGKTWAVEISIAKSFADTPTLKESKVKGRNSIALLLMVYKSSFFLSLNSFSDTLESPFFFCVDLMTVHKSSRRIIGNTINSSGNGMALLSFE